MTHVPDGRGTAAGVRNYPGGEAAGPQHFRFLRFSHIFASVMREILEVQLLEEVIPHSLSLTQFHLLKAIALDGGHPMGDVAEFLGVSAPAGTKVIDKLERLGLVRRVSRSGDRRVRFLTASAKGLNVIGEYERLKAERLEPILRAIPAQDVEGFTGMLERFSLALAGMDRGGALCCVWCAGYCANDCPVGESHGGCPIQKLSGPGAPGDSGDAGPGRRKGRGPHSRIRE